MKKYLFIFSLLFIETKSFNIQRRNFLDGIINFHNGLFVSSNMNSNEVDIREINNNIIGRYRYNTLKIFLFVNSVILVYLFQIS